MAAPSGDAAVACDLDGVAELGAGLCASAALKSLIRTADPTVVPPGLRWSVRDVAAHLVGATALYVELAAGAASPVGAITPEVLGEFNAQRIADVADNDPDQLAKSMTDTVSRFLDASGRFPDEPVHWHAGIALNTTQLTCVLLGEYLLHGLDVATATGAPWPIDPRHSALVLYGYGPVLPACVDAVTSVGHTAGYLLELGIAGRLAVRFTNGTPTVGPADDAPYDCTITADPTAFLLVSTGRMHQSTAIALSLISAGGARPDLGLTFGSRFRYP